MMTNPNKPNIPGLEAMTDSLEFVKNLWGNMGIPGMNAAGTGAPPGGMPGMAGMNIPGMVMPTMSVEEIRKKITDLKAVESWLNLNMGMLRSTIQALEVQAATLTTLQSMSETFAASMSGFGGAGTQGAPGGNGVGNGKSAAAQPGTQADGQGDASLLTASMVNTAAWWNMLQEQFGNAVANAMAKAETPSQPEQAAGPKTKQDTKTADAATPGAGASRRKNGKPAE